MKTVIRYSDENYKHKWAIANGDHTDQEGLGPVMELPFELMEEEEYLNLCSKEDGVYVDDEGKPIKMPEFVLTITREEAEEHVRKGAKLIQMGSAFNFPNNVTPLILDGEYFPTLNKLIPVLHKLDMQGELSEHYDVSLNIAVKKDSWRQLKFK